MRFPTALATMLTFTGCALGLLLSGCSLVSPGCRNRDAKAAIEAEAHESARTRLASFGSGAVRFVARATFELKDAHETAVNGDTHSCAANMMVGEGQGRVAVPIDYQVSRGEGGQTLYGWDAVAFVNSFIQRETMAAITLAMQSRSSREPPRAASPDTGPSAEASAVRPEDSGWGEVVKDEILAQAGRVPVEGSGTVTVSFDVSLTGDIGNARVVRSSGDAGLDAAALRVVERTAHIDAPYGEAVVGFTMKLSFL